MLLRLLPFTAFVISIALLSFIGGAMVVFTEVFPHPWLRDAYLGGKAALEKEVQSVDRYQTDFWFPERTTAKGVTLHEADRAQAGFTLYTSGHDTRAFLVSMTGEVVHEWHLPFSAVWDETAAVRNPQPDSFMYWRKAMLFPNGDLLAIYVAAGDSPWGYGLVKLDRHSRVIWKYLQQTHHDMDVGGDGRIYALTHEVRFNTYPGFEQLQVPRIDDFVVVLSPDGQQERKIPVIDALVASPYSRLLSRLAWYTKGDYLHTNGIDLIEGEGADKLRVGSEGQVLLSLREIDMIAILDLQRQEIVWALRGPWFAQHDPDLLPNGNILLYDNRGHYGEGGQSRIIEIDPVTSGVVWSYAGTPAQPFDSEVRGAQHRLANGNTLITESLSGRIFEVTSGGEIVWEFINPVRAKDRRIEDGRALIPIVSWAQRVEAADLDPDFLGAKALAHARDHTRAGHCVRPSGGINGPLADVVADNGELDLIRPKGLRRMQSERLVRSTEPMACRATIQLKVKPPSGTENFPGRRRHRLRARGIAADDSRHRVVRPPDRFVRADPRWWPASHERRARLSRLK